MLTITNMAKQPGTLTELLRELLAGSVQRQVCLATGLDTGSVSRFAAGKRSLRLDMADKLAAYYGVVHTVPKGRGAKARRGKANAAAARTKEAPRRSRRGSVKG